MNGTLRVLMVSDVSPSRPAGGGERMLWEQARRLAARGHDVRVVSRADPDATAPVSVERERVRIHQFLADRRSTTRFITSSIYGARRVVSEVLAREPADVPHVPPAPDRGAIRGELGLSADRAILLTVRNLEARMGLDNLLGAMAVLKVRRPSALLLIGGAGSLRGALEAQSQALGLSEHVKFLGFVPDAELPRYYQAADVFVLPTRELEGFGLVTVEALACGTPVLGTPVGATPEILRALCPTLVFRGPTAAP